MYDTLTEEIQYNDIEMTDRTIIYARYNRHVPTTHFVSTLQWFIVNTYKLAHNLNCLSAN